jgi:transcriptional regulator with XRE-family HTH domain
MRRLQPARARRRLTRRLQDLRENAGYKQAELGRILEWSQSKVQRIENGVTPITRADLFFLLRALAVPEESTEFKELDELAALARARPKYVEYKDILDAQFLDYLQEEWVADRLRQYEPSMVPGILQIRAYTLALLRDFYDTENVSERERDERIVRAERMASLRQERQADIFVRAEEGSIKAEFLLDESVVMHAVGNEVGEPHIMDDQLKFILEAATRKNISIGILPFSAGAHRGLLGSFAILSFPDDEPSLLFIENSAEDLATKEKPDETNARIAMFQSLQERAFYGAEFESVVQAARARIPQR